MSGDVNEANAVEPDGRQREPLQRIAEHGCRQRKLCDRWLHKISNDRLEQ